MAEDRHHHALAHAAPLKVRLHSGHVEQAGQRQKSLQKETPSVLLYTEELLETEPSFLYQLNSLLRDRLLPKGHQPERCEHDAFTQ